MLHAGRAGSTTAWWHGSGTGTRCVPIRTSRPLTPCGTHPPASACPFLSSVSPGKGITMWRQLELGIGLFQFQSRQHVLLPFRLPLPHLTLYLLLPAAIIASRLAWLVYRQGHHSTKLFPLLSTSAVSSGLPIRSLAALPRPNSRFSDLFQHRHSSRAQQGHLLCISSPDPVQPERLQVRAPLPASSLPCFLFLPVSS